MGRQPLTVFNIYTHPQVFTNVIGILDALIQWPEDIVQQQSPQLVHTLLQTHGWQSTCL